MSDHAIQSYNASSERRHPLNNNQSLGMSHSVGASFNSARQEQNQLSTPLGQLTLGEGGNASDIPGPQFRNVESGIGCLTTGSKNYSISRPIFQAYPISYQSQPPVFYQSQQSWRRFILNFDRETRDIQLLRSRLAHNFGNTNNTLCINGGGFSSVQRATPLWAQTSQSNCRLYD